MQITKLITDEDRAVSPVIGVILMVAITVILAAVIASFVLGLGGTSDPAPTPTAEWSDDGDFVNISITGGDRLDSSNLEVQGDGLEETGPVDTTPQILVNGDGDTDAEDISAGDTISIELDDTVDDWEVNVIWETAENDPEIILSNDG